MRYLGAGLVLVTLLVTAFVVADQVLLAKLEANQEAVVAAGGHLELSDFALNLQESENGASFYRRAHVLVNKADETEEFDWAELSARYAGSGACDCVDAGGEELPPVTAEEEAELAGFIERHADVFAAIEEGAKRPFCQFGNYSEEQTMGDNVATKNMPDMTAVRNIGRLVMFRSVWESRHGNLDGAYHWLAVGLHVSNGLENDPLVITGLVGPAVEGLVLGGLKVILCENALLDPVPNEFMAELEIAAGRQRVARFFDGENCFSNGLESASTKLWNRPFKTLSRIYMLKNGAEILSIMKESDEGLSVQRLAQYGEETREPSRLAPHRILADLMRGSLSMSAGGILSSVAHARAAQVVVALKQWKAQHGSYPAALDEVGMLPVDPMTAKGFEYQREGEGFVLRAGGVYGKRAVKWCMVK